MKENDKPRKPQRKGDKPWQNERRGRSESWKPKGERKPKRRFAKPKLDPSPQSIDPNPRLNKYLASAGIASRRKCDELIAAGLVTVNEEVVLEMGYRVQENDVVRYKGKVVTPETRKVYILMNKPKNTITTAKDPQGRRTVIDIVYNACEERVYPVGRLDRNTTGLLLLTNDGELAKKLAHPSYRVKKIYHVTLDKPITPEELNAITAGLALEDGLAEVDKVQYHNDKDNEVLIELHIGKNRIVRRIFSHLGYEVQRLDRVYYAGLTKKDIQRGNYRFLTEMEIRMLRHFT